MNVANLALTSVVFALCGSGLLAQQAGSADYAKLVTALKQICLKTFPSFDGIDAIATASGFAKTKDGAWTDSDIFLKADRPGTPAGKRVCMLNLRNISDAKSVSNALQAQLQTLGLKGIRATRKGVRLSVDFIARGGKGNIRVEPLGGRTASIIVLVK